MAAVLLAIAPSRAAGADTEFFETRVRPVLVQHCYKCHSEGSGKSKGGLLLDTRDGMRKGGSRGAAVVPGDPDKSLFIETVRHANPDLQMPREGDKLSDAQVADLVKWVQQGAADPRIETGVNTAADPAKAAAHWAFQPPGEPPIPVVRQGDWPKSPIDRFTLAKLEGRGLKPSPPADKRTLIRRATFDLTGLPPAPADVQTFLADGSDEAFDRVVARLLATSQYGERWGRHWLDVVRYADTAGDGSDYPAPLAYRYRDYVIDAFNRDAPYDAFLREQIAGDVLAEQGAATETPETYARRVIATGYLAISKRFSDDTTKQFRHLDLADTIDVLGKSVLGLSVGCARCHDHKYDPVSVADYYSLYGIFQSTTFSFAGGEVHPRPEYLVPLAMPAERDRLDAERHSKLAEIERQINAAGNERATLSPQSASRGGQHFAFEPLAVGDAPGAPWVSDGVNVVSADAQSPFTHVYPPGTRGLRLSGGANPGDGVRQPVEVRKPTHKSLFINLDFRSSHDT
ncbi:MAG: DUF1549 domain-containing protein, partial [Chthoniobacterales bacterium]|nr:DUF1549 domain-containing protein [Chthoniobacterales bacterium]